MSAHEKKPNSPVTLNRGPALPRSEDEEFESLDADEALLEIDPALLPKPEYDEWSER